jgi:hypothetical protein
VRHAVRAPIGSSMLEVAHENHWTCNRQMSGNQALGEEA